jgi:response regulator RpfG family c-di-GMP phosphodiesterase
MNHKILIVDDETANLRLLERLFRREYQVLTATSGGEALELLKMHDIALIISDQRMPGMTGIEFLKQAAAMRPHTVRIILTGYTDVNALVEAINSGVVYKYVTKPWVNEDLQQTVVRAIEHYVTIKSQYELTLQNERLAAQLNRMKQIAVRLIGETLDLKDSSLHEHLQRTSGYATALGRRLGLSDSELEQLSLAAFLHDVGKIGVSEAILSKTAPLTAEENHTVKSCAERGVRMLAIIPDMNEIAVAVRYHTEHFDGTGFPDGLSAEQIPLFSRIIAVAGAYDEITVSRDENKILTHAEAVEKLRGNAGKQFDASVVEELSKIESIDKIRRTIANGIVGMRLSIERIPCDEKNMSTGEVLQKFKTEPLLAFDVLKTGNRATSEPTAQLLPLMSKIGEAELRSLLRQFGLPSADKFTKAQTTQALRRAVAAQLIAAHTGFIHPDDAYTLGLLHNVGETLLFNLFPDRMLELKNFDAPSRARRQVELFGLDAAQISRWMLESGGMPENLTVAIENQPNFMRINRPVALVMQIAREIADNEPTDKSIQMNAIESNVLEALKLRRGDLNKIYERVNFITEEHVEAPEEVLELAY